MGIALMGNSHVLIMDEPTTGLDILSKNIIINLIKVILLAVEVNQGYSIGNTLNGRGR